MTEYLIIGGGIIGLTTAKALLERFPGCSITIIEKEKEVACHASGRNSGVLHAGIYYKADSLKAKFCKDGNEAWLAYCDENNLRVNRCGKVVVTASEEELSSLYEIEKRSSGNSRRIDEKELSEIEPNARTFKHALHVPVTSVVDPVEICNHLQNKLINQGVKFLFGAPYVKRLSGSKIQAGDNIIEYKTLINCAGLYADKIANDFGCSKDYTIIPFKGLYLKYSGSDKPVKTNIYPVPNLKNPFLGVHFTMTVDGGIKIGPTAIPAFWRENYDIQRFNLSEMIDILGWEARLFLSNAFGFRNLAFEEMKKYKRNYMIGQAVKMVKNIDGSGFNKWSKPGIRAQLLNKSTKELVQDFVVEKNENSIHILNAVSPAFTCSIPFSRWVVGSL